MIRISNKVACLLILLASTMFSSCTRHSIDKVILAKSVSPDGKRIAAIMASSIPGVPADTHLEVMLTSQFTTSEKGVTVYSSPDMGTPGTEKIIWSRDGRFFLITGRQFAVDVTNILRNGERLYFLYDTQKWHGWCNDLQDSMDRFSTGDLGRAGFDGY